MQLDHHAECAMIIFLNEATNGYEFTNAEVPDGVDGPTRDMLERCMTTCGRAAGTRAKMRSLARKEASLKKFEDTTNNNLLKQNTLNTFHGLITRFLISLT